MSTLFHTIRKSWQTVTLLYRFVCCIRFPVLASTGFTYFPSVRPSAQPTGKTGKNYKIHANHATKIQIKSYTSTESKEREEITLCSYLLTLLVEVRWSPLCKGALFSQCIHAYYFQEPIMSECSWECIYFKNK